jgi:hypothetical protein
MEATFGAEPDESPSMSAAFTEYHAHNVIRRYCPNGTEADCSQHLVLVRIL